MVSATIGASSQAEPQHLGRRIAGRAHTLLEVFSIGQVAGNAWGVSAVALDENPSPD